MDKITFSGFPKEGLQFLEDLKMNNEREWFNNRKQDYIDYVQNPAQDFVLTFGEKLKSISPGFVYDTRMNGSGSVLRIYRDVRFSKNKSPYNTRLRIFFWEGTGKKMENPGIFFGLDERGARLHGGLFKFPKIILTAYRDAIIDDQLGNELQTVIKTLQTTENYDVGGKHYKRVPRGYDKEHPLSELLMYNGLYASSPLIDPSIAITSELLDVCFEYCLKMAPLHQWLVRVHQSAT